MSSRKRWALTLVLLFLIGGLSSLLVRHLVPPDASIPPHFVKHAVSLSEPNRESKKSFSSWARNSPLSKGSSGFTKPAQASLLESGPKSFTVASVRDGLSTHIDKTLNYIYQNIHPETRLSYSLPGDKRLTHWSVVYDNAMRAMVHTITGDLENAKRTIDYFIENTAIQKMGWIDKNGRLVVQKGWVVNIVDAAELRDGGRGIEHIAHTGPNVFLGIAAIHVYRATLEKRYLNYARERWTLIKGLQNENPQDFNYGGVRMGPMGNPNNFLEQRLDFKPENPSFYEIYNGEHAADFRAFCELMALVDEKNRDEYQRAADLIAIWDHKIYDKQRHLFAIGTTEMRYFEPNVGEWVGPGVMDIYPLDTQALKINTYGIEGLEQFESNGAEKIRKAIDDNFKVQVKTKSLGNERTVWGYDFVCHRDRKRLIRYREEGPAGDRKVKKGIGRDPILSDEWSTWVAMSDLRLAKDAIRLGDRDKAARYWGNYRANALIQGLKTADSIHDGFLAYPYAHPLPYSLNVPVGFGWNTHHTPYSIIGGVSRIMGFMGFDPFSLDSLQYSYKVKPGRHQYANRFDLKPSQTLVTEAEEYINRAWGYVVLANRRGPQEENLWRMAAQTVEQMNKSHADWLVIAMKQNKEAHQSEDPFPLLGLAPVSPKDLEPIYRRYWALYHVGTGEFIRVMAYTKLASIAKKKGLRIEQQKYEEKVKEASLNIVKNYYYSQAFDDSNGWMWQPINSLKEYVSPSILQTIEGYQVAVERFRKISE